MKASLTFDMNKPGERREHELALYGPAYAMALHELDEWLKQQTKHAKRTARTMALEEVRKYMTEQLDTPMLWEE